METVEATHVYYGQCPTCKGYPAAVMEDGSAGEMVKQMIDSGLIVERVPIDLARTEAFLMKACKHEEKRDGDS